MTIWSPELWDDFSTVGLIVALVAFHGMAYLRGWLIPGRHHKEILATRDREVAQAGERAIKDAETIRIQAQTIAEKNAVEDAGIKILEAVRALSAGGDGR